MFTTFTFAEINIGMVCYLTW